MQTWTAVLGTSPALRAAVRARAHLIDLKAFKRATCASVPRKVATENRARPTHSSWALAIRVSISQSMPMPAQALTHALSVSSCMASGIGHSCQQLLPRPGQALFRYTTTTVGSDGYVSTWVVSGLYYL